MSKMGTQQQNTRAIANSKHGIIEQQTIVDDNLLPSAEELSKLKEINPLIIEWILQRSEKEQDTRLNFNTEQMRLAHKEINIAQTSLWLAFSLAIAIFVLSGLFIWLGKEIAGTVFGSVGVFVVVQSFLRFGRKEKQ
ncbi:hypothetical protein SAMD00024442_8_17 [Candidatus Symbiothrix dinenymphae]|nr:hypothetical protein SAMD00024442_8_17 [Candidatus Symbiothrix dinenymphae]